MKVRQIIEFTEEDKVLLKKGLPDNPCSTCCIGIGCTGCGAEVKYCHMIKIYQEAGIYEIALKLKDISDLEKQIKKNEDRIISLKTEIPEEVFEFVSDDKNITINKSEEKSVLSIRDDGNIVLF